MKEKVSRKDPKRKFALWIRESTLDSVKKIYKEDNCSSQSEFIEKAVLFYVGYLSAENNKSYLPNVVTSTLKGIVAESDNRQNRMMFKFAVEMAVMMNVVASINAWTSPVSTIAFTWFFLPEQPTTIPCGKGCPFGNVASFPLFTCSLHFSGVKGICS